jgi:hypothetical protein
MPSPIRTTLFATVSALAPVRAPVDPPLGRAGAVIDLATRERTALIQATWRYHDAALVAIDGRAPSANLKPSGKRLRTHDAWTGLCRVFLNITGAGTAAVPDALAGK